MIVALADTCNEISSGVKDGKVEATNLLPQTEYLKRIRILKYMLILSQKLSNDTAGDHIKSLSNCNRHFQPKLQLNSLALIKLVLPFIT